MQTDLESLYLIFFECRHTKQFWKEFQYYFYTLTREQEVPLPDSP